VNRFQRSAAASRDHRPARRLCFDRRHPEVFDAGKDERTTALHMVNDDRVRERAEELDIRSGEALQVRQGSTLADDPERKPGVVAGPHGAIDPFVRHET